MTSMRKKVWMGTWPADCDLCHAPLAHEDYFVDGRTVMGPWGLLCPRCHRDYGVGLGQGYGQKYDATTREKLDG